MVPAARGRRPRGEALHARSAGHGSERASPAGAPLAPSRSRRAHEAPRGGTGPGGDGGSFKGAGGCFLSGTRLAAVALVAGLADPGRRRGFEPRRSLARGARIPRGRRPEGRRRSPGVRRKIPAHALAPVPGVPPARPRGIPSPGREPPSRRCRRARESARRGGRPLETPLLCGGRPVDRGDFRDRPGRHAEVLLLRVVRKRARRARAPRADDDPGRRLGREGPHPRSGTRSHRREHGRRAGTRSPLRGARRSARREIERVGREAPARPRQGRRPPARGGAGEGRSRRGARAPRARDPERVLPRRARPRSEPRGKRGGPGHDRGPEERAADERRDLRHALLRDLRASSLARRGARRTVLLRRKGRRREWSCGKPRAFHVRGARSARAAREKTRPRIGIRLDRRLAGRFPGRCSNQAGGGTSREKRQAPAGVSPRRCAAGQRAARPPRRGLGRCLGHLRRNSLLFRLPSRRFRSRPAASP